MDKNSGLLNKINCPSDVKKLDQKQINCLVDEIRLFLIDNVTKSGGHLASNLGVVELTVALHRVFNTPHDHIVWDVGHQAYVHKILTGRRDMFDSLRQCGGLSGFTNRNESEHDCFGAGHSSTSLSAALGFAEADMLRGVDAYTIVVLGDGAFTGGMIHEALNNCNKNLKLIIIINENEMSISKNTGRFAKSLSSLRSKPGYFQTKKTTGNIIKKIPLIGDWLFKLIRNTKKSLKNMLYGSNYFEDIGLYYIGPIDGNDEQLVEIMLKEAKKLDESVVIHLKTTKGKGYEAAEKQPHLYHSVPPANKPVCDKSFSSECGRILCEKARENNNIVAITAAMSYGTGLEVFRKKYPDRFFDVGIAEEHALTFAAGLAAAGMRPVVAIYSTFLQRGFDNIIHDIALQNLPVVMCIDRAGLNLGDGVTHHGIFDVSFLSGLPNVRIYTPATFDSLQCALNEAVELSQPIAIRYPSGGEDQRITKLFDSGHGAVKLQKYAPDNCDTFIIVHGRMVATALDVCDILESKGIDAASIMLTRITPFDDIASQIRNTLPKSAKYIVFVEEEIGAGGMGMMLSDAINRICANDGIESHTIAVSDPFVRCERNMTYHQMLGLDSETIANKIINIKKGQISG